MFIREHKMNLALFCPCCESEELKKSSAILMPFMTKMIFDYDLFDIDESWNLYGVPNSKIYMPCKSVQCQNCGFLFSDFRFDDNELKNLYENYRETKYNDIRDFYEPGYKDKQKILDEPIGYKKDIEKFLDFIKYQPLILDWGGDDGKNTPFLETANKIHIYELTDKELLNNCEKIELEEIPNYNYDLIVCSNVLEHVSYPKELVKDITECMKEDTILYIEVPYENLMAESDGSLDLYKSKKHWHEHINFYSKKSLYSLVESCGLEIIKDQVYNYKKALDCVHFTNLYMLACKIKK
jgi:SAM-dependent methyltransferase